MGRQSYRGSSRFRIWWWQRKHGWYVCAIVCVHEYGDFSSSPALSVIGTGDSSSNFDQKQNAGKLHLSEDDDFDLEEIGGDPGFLDDDDTGGGDDDKTFESMQFDKEMDDDLFWDGLVDEDAHLDFDWYRDEVGIGSNCM